MIQSIFISKNASEVTELSLFCQEQKIELVAHSLIEFNKTPFEAAEKTDCVFFSSPRSASFFLSKQKLTQQMIAVAGNSTKQTVESFGYRVDFVPSKSGLTQQSIIEFSSWIQHKTVLFPISNISKKSYASRLKPEQVCYINVYETIKTSIQIGTCDCYIFSSPSNVESFLELNVLPKGKLIVAYGESTSTKLLSSGIQNSIILEHASQEAIIDYLKTKLD